MTPAELKTLIEADAAALALFEAGNDAACAVRCSVIAPKVYRETILTERGLYVVLGATMAETILQKLAGFAATNATQSPIIARVLDWLKPNNGGVDFGDPQTLGLVRLLTQGQLFTAEEYAAISAIALVPQTITEAQIERARAI